MTQEALKLALDALETELSIDWTNNDEFNASAEKMYEAITAIKEALAQEQEPVVWGTDWGRAGDIPCVSIIKRLPNGGIQVLAVEYAPYSYTTPPQRTWVGLEGEEIRNLWEEATKPDRSTMTMVTSFAKSIEAKLKQKNGYAEENT